MRGTPTFFGLLCHPTIDVSLQFYQEIFGNFRNLEFYVSPFSAKFGLIIKNSRFSLEKYYFSKFSAPKICSFMSRKSKFFGVAPSPPLNEGLPSPKYSDTNPHTFIKGISFCSSTLTHRTRHMFR